MSRDLDPEGVLCSFRMHGTARLVPRRQVDLEPVARGTSRTTSAVSSRPVVTDGGELFRRLWKGTVKALLEASASSSVVKRPLYGPKTPPELRRGVRQASEASGNGKLRPKNAAEFSSSSSGGRPPALNSLKSVVR